MTRTTTSASNFFRRVACPGSHNAESHAPESPDNPDSERGSRLHWLEAQEIEDGGTISETEFLKRNKALRDEFMEIQRDKYKIAQNEPCVTVRDNLEFWLRDERGVKLDICGHPDLIFFYPRMRLAFIFDTKTGRYGAPKAEVNYQLRIYALSACDPLYGEFAADTVVGIISAPLCRPSITSVVYDAESLALAKVEVLNIWRNSQLKDAPRYAGYAQCNFCRALGSCEQGLNLARELATTKISELPIAKLEALRPTMIMAQKVINAYESKLKLIAEKTPELLTNLELKPGAVVESVDPADTDNAGALLQVHGALSKEQFGECRKLTMSKVRQIVGENLSLSEDDTKAKVAQILKPVLRVKRNAPSLVERKRVVMLENK